MNERYKLMCIEVARWNLIPDKEHDVVKFKDGYERK